MPGAFPGAVLAGEVQNHDVPFANSCDPMEHCHECIQLILGINENVRLHAKFRGLWAVGARLAGEGHRPGTGDGAEHGAGLGATVA